MLTLTAVVTLWTMARPVELPRRARLAINSVLGIAFAQVSIYLFHSSMAVFVWKRGSFFLLFSIYLKYTFLHSRYCLGFQHFSIMSQSTWPRCTNQDRWRFSASLYGLEMRSRVNGWLKFENYAKCILVYTAGGGGGYILYCHVQKKQLLHNAEIHSTIVFVKCKGIFKLHYQSIGNYEIIFPFVDWIKN